MRHNSATRKIPNISNSQILLPRFSPKGGWRSKISKIASTVNSNDRFPSVPYKCHVSKWPLSTVTQPNCTRDRAGQEFVPPLGPAPKNWPQESTSGDLTRTCVVQEENRIAHFLSNQTNANPRALHQNFRKPKNRTESPQKFRKSNNFQNQSRGIGERSKRTNSRNLAPQETGPHSLVTMCSYWQQPATTSLPTSSSSWDRLPKTAATVREPSGSRGTRMRSRNGNVCLKIPKRGKPTDGGGGT